MATIQVALENLTYAGVQFNKVSFERRDDEDEENSKNHEIILHLDYSHGVTEEGHVFEWNIESAEDDPLAIEIELVAVYRSKDSWEFPSEDDTSSFYMEVVLPVLYQAVERAQNSLWGLFGVTFRLIPEISFFRAHFDPRDDPSEPNDAVEV